MGNINDFINSKSTSRATVTKPKKQSGSRRSARKKKKSTGVKKPSGVKPPVPKKTNGDNA